MLKVLIVSSIKVSRITCIQSYTPTGSLLRFQHSTNASAVAAPPCSVQSSPALPAWPAAAAAAPVWRCRPPQQATACSSCCTLQADSDRRSGGGRARRLRHVHVFQTTGHRVTHKRGRPRLRPRRLHVPHVLDRLARALVVLARLRVTAANNVPLPLVYIPDGYCCTLDLLPVATCDSTLVGLVRGQMGDRCCHQVPKARGSVGAGYVSFRLFLLNITRGQSAPQCSGLDTGKDKEMRWER